MVILKVKEYIRKKNSPEEIGGNLTEAFKIFLDKHIIGNKIKFGPIDGTSFNIKLKPYYKDDEGITDSLLDEIYVSLLAILEKSEKEELIVHELWLTPGLIIENKKMRAIVAHIKNA